MSAKARDRRRVAVVTGSRAEFGLLAPVMRAIAAHPSLELQVVVAGAHLLPPSETRREVAAEFEIAAEVPMQRPGETGRAADARALGRGVSGFAEAFDRLAPDFVLLLGDRIEPFAAVSAASIGGRPIAHIHGGDRAEGVADEAMRHAITKLAHVHFPATAASAERIGRMGEDESRIHIVGSPAIDGLAGIEAMSDADAAALGDPDVIFLMHPVGDDREVERRRAAAGLEALRGRRVLALHPNFDAGREGVLDAIGASGVRAIDHAPRPVFIGLLKRLARRAGGMIVGNSSAALIECAALRLPAVNLGPRQAGRERAGNIVDVRGEGGASDVHEAIERAMRIERSGLGHPYGDGRSGVRIAKILGKIGEGERVGMIRKRCAY